MAEKDDESLIGYDPLAWLNEPGKDRSEESTSAPSDINVEETEQEDAQMVDIKPDTNDDDLTIEQAVLTEEGDEVGSMEQSLQLVLESVQNIQNVAQLHERLLRALDSANKIDIDASAITTIDTATLQLLLVLKQTAVKMQKHVSIDFPSEKFIEAAELLGLAEMLDVDQAAAGFF